MDLRQVDYVLAVVDRGSFTKAADVDARESAVALRRDPPARSRARRAAVPSPRSIGRAHRRRTRLRRPGPPAHPGPRRGRSSRSPVFGACVPGTLDFVSLSTLAADPLGRLVGRFRKAHPGIVVRIAAPDDVGAVDAMVLDGRCELGPDRAPAPPRRARVGAARTAGDRGGVPAPHPPPGAGAAARGEAAGHAAWSRRRAACRPVISSTGRSPPPGSSRSSPWRRRSARRSRRSCSRARARRSCPPRLAKSLGAQGAVVARLVPTLTRTIGLVHRPAPLTPAARAFVELARPRRRR